MQLTFLQIVLKRSARQYDSPFGVDELHFFSEQRISILH